MEQEKDKFYSHSELLGQEPGDFWTETYYSEEEVGEITDLFSEFYETRGDLYADADEAYEYFMDAYADANKVSFKVGKTATTVGATALGAGLGLGAAHLATKNMRSSCDKLEQLVNEGMATKEEFSEYKKCRAKLRMISTGSAIAGGGLAYGGVQLGRKHNSTIGKNTLSSDLTYSDIRDIARSRRN